MMLFFEDSAMGFVKIIRVYACDRHYITIIIIIFNYTVRT
jgi:hypothetical protein